MVLKEKLTIIVVTHNSMSVFPAYLDNLVKALDGQDCIILVCDNRSSDGIEEFLAKNKPSGVKLLKSECNEGYGGALNRGIQEAETPYVALMNPDVAVEPGGFEVPVRFLEERPHAAGVTGLQKNVTSLTSNFDVKKSSAIEKIAVHYRFETLFDRIMFYSGLASKFSDAVWAVPWTMVDTSSEIEVKRIHGAFGVFQKQSLIEVGLYDPRFFVYFEEDDLATRLGQKGYKLYITDRFMIFHLSSHGSEEFSSSFQADKVLINSQYIYFKKYHGNLYTWFSFMAIWIVISLVLLYMFCTRHKQRARFRMLWQWHLQCALGGGRMPEGTIPHDSPKEIDYS